MRVKQLMKADQKALSFPELQKNVKTSAKKINKSHCENFIKYAYENKKTRIQKKKKSTLKNKPKKYKIS